MICIHYIGKQDYVVITKFIMPLGLFRSESNILKRKGYTLGQDLGEGSYAKVKSATWTRPGQEKPLKVALKIINENEIPQDFKVKFLPRELEIVRTLDHRNVIKTMEIFTGGKKIYLTLEFAGHGDLLGYIQLRGPLREDDSAVFFRQIALGLQYLHHNGVVHRDLKCENILLNHSDVAKIADFGFSRKMSAKDLSSTYCGSAAYAAPEILQGVPYRGNAADIWSLGVILFIMNCGIMPFRDKNMKTLVLDQKSPLRYSQKLDKTLSPLVKSLMQNILESSISQRFDLPAILNHEWTTKGISTPKIQEVSLETPNSDECVT